MKILKYKTIELKKGDNIKVGLYVRLAKRDCASVVDLKDSNLTESSLIKELLFEVDWQILFYYYWFLSTIISNKKRI